MTKSRRTWAMRIATAIAIVGISTTLTWLARQYVQKQIDTSLAVQVTATNNLSRKSAQLQSQVNALAKLVINLDKQLPLISDYRGVGASVLSMFDAVGPYRKNGLFEHYGLDVREQRSGPINVTETALTISHDEAWVMWSPDYFPARDATHLELDFVEMPSSGRLTVGFILTDGSTDTYSYDFGPPTKATPNLPPPIWPEDVLKLMKTKLHSNPLKKSGAKLISPISSQLMLQLRGGGDGKVQAWFVRASGAAKTIWRIRKFTLIRPVASATTSAVTLVGRVQGATLAAGTQIELLEETGALHRNTLTADGTFRFTGIRADRPVSVRLQHLQTLRYATIGRWFVPAYSRDDIKIDHRPSYVNLDGHAPDPETIKFIGARTPSKVAAFYEPHSRQHWPGTGTVQEYDSTTFTNNHGYVDRDRFWDNPDSCIRLANVGGSEMVALQIRPFEKFNILLEEMLGVAIGKCVEVISAATDNGDIGTNYPRIRDYTSKFKVDFTLVSTYSGLIHQVSPQMLKDSLGIDHSNNAFPNFYFNKNGVLTFRKASPVYAVYTTKPTLPNYAKSIPFHQTLRVPFDSMPAQGIEALRYWTAIAKHIDKHIPNQRMIFHTGVEQAQCRKHCESTVTLENGKAVRAGAKVFVENIKKYCMDNGFTCMHPSFSPVYGEIENYLTFQFDSHLSLLGHQWLAKELTPLLAKHLKSAGKW